jgi:signal peptidase I
VFVYTVERSKDFIKRVIGLGGDTVKIRGKKVLINERVTEYPMPAFLAM